MTRASLSSLVRALAVATVAVATVAACASGPRTTFPPLGATPGAAGDLTDATESLVIAALGAVGLPAAEATLPYRPPEGPLFAGAPRTVLQATLPDDPTHGFVVIYAFQSPQAADAAAADHAAFVSRNPGGIFPRGSRFVLRVVGSTVVSFWWIPDSVVDPRTALIEEALLAVGSEVPVPG
jgi:hypothetical protein